MIRRRPGIGLVLLLALTAAAGCGGGPMPLAVTRAQFVFQAAPAVDGPAGAPAQAPAADGTAPAGTPQAALPVTLPVGLPAAGPVSTGGSGGGSSGGGSAGGGSSAGGTTPAPDAGATATPDATATDPGASPAIDPSPDATADPAPGASPTATPAATPTPTPVPTPTPTPAGTLVTWAGNGSAGTAEGQGTTARFNTPYGVAADAAGNLYVADAFNHRIRKVTPAGLVTTVAGTGAQGYADGPGAQAMFNSPLDIAAQADGTLYVSDTLNHAIRKITFDAQGRASVRTLAGDPAIARDFQGSPILSYPVGLAVTPGGTVYVADPGMQAIRAIAPSGVVTNLAGKYWDVQGGFADGTGTAALFQEPMDVTLDRQGNLVVADTSNHRIRRVTPAGVVTTLAGAGALGVWGGGYADGAAATAVFNHPYGVAVDALGNVIVADKDNHRLRKLTPGGMVSTLAGTGTAGLVDGPGGSARLNSPVGLAFGPLGRLVVADAANHALRLLYP